MHSVDREGVTSHAAPPTAIPVPVLTRSLLPAALHDAHLCLPTLSALDLPSQTSRAGKFDKDCLPPLQLDLGLSILYDNPEV